MCGASLLSRNLCGAAIQGISLSLLFLVRRILVLQQDKSTWRVLRYSSALVSSLKTVGAEPPGGGSSACRFLCAAIRLLLLCVHAFLLQRTAREHFVRKCVGVDRSVRSPSWGG